MHTCRVGLALGGGGARGIAHIPVLEALDDLGVRPHRIAGTSIGAIMGALYAFGATGREIREKVNRLTISREDSLEDIVRKKDLLKWFEAMAPAFGRGGIMRTDRLLRVLFDDLRSATFENLAIPLAVVAADYWTYEPVVFRSGDLCAAVRASMCIPAVFAPVEHEGRVLVDGGVVNPVPYDLLLEDCDVTIAVDVLGTVSPGRTRVPRMLDSVLNAFQIVQKALQNEKERRVRPGIWVRPDIRNVGVLQFDKVRQVLRSAQPAADALKHELAALLA